MATVWDDDTIFKLIELFEAERVLWDCTSREYKNKIKKSMAWVDIALALDIPRIDVEVKMHILRSQFARERKKIMLSRTKGVRTANNEKSKWKFYEALKFLLSVASTSGVSGIKNKKTNLQDLKTEQLLEADAMYTSSTPPASPTQPQQLDPLCSQQTATHGIEDKLNEIYQFVKSAKRKKGDFDEFDIYGQYVASELRAAINENGVLQAKSYINGILIDMRMGKYDYNYDDQTNQVYVPASASESVCSEKEEFDEFGGLVSQIKSETEAGLHIQ